MGDRWNIVHGRRSTVQGRRSTAFYIAAIHSSILLLFHQEIWSATFFLGTLLQGFVKYEHCPQGNDLMVEVLGYWLRDHRFKSLLRPRFYPLALPLVYYLTHRLCFVGYCRSPGRFSRCERKLNKTPPL